MPPVNLSGRGGWRVGNGVDYDGADDETAYDEADGEGTGKADEATAGAADRWSRNERRTFVSVSSRRYLPLHFERGVACG